MAAQIGSLFVSLTADIQPFAREMARAERISGASANAIRRQVGLTEKSVGQLNRAFAGTNFRPYGLLAASKAFESAADRANLLRGALLSATAVFGGFTAALTSNILLRYADSAVKLTNQLRAVTEGNADLVATQRAVEKTANDSRASLSATATLYARIRRAVPTESAESVLDIVSNIQRGLQLGGASAQEAASAMIQLSQGLASNRLQGEELRALLETPLGNYLAEGLGVTIGQLREMGTEGKLTADRVLGALKKVGPAINEAFGKSAITIDQALQIADNNLTKYIGTIDQTYGITGQLSSAIISLSENLDTLGFYAGIAALAFGSIYAARGPEALVRRFQNLREAAKANVTEARQEVDGLRKSLAAADQQLSNARKAEFSGGVFSGADPEKVREYRRATQEVRSLEQARAKSLADVDAALRQLDTVQSTVSTKAIALADRQAAAEAKVIENKRVLRSLNDRLVSAQNSRTLIPELGLTDKELKQALKDNERVIAESRKQIQAIEADSLKQERIISESAASIANLRADADKKAADRRLAIRRDLNAKLAELSKQERDLAAGRANASSARAGVIESSRAFNADEIARAQAGVQNLERALAASEARLGTFARAASIGAVAIGGLRTAATSLYGFLGGGWGIAFTAAIASLGLYAQSSAKAAAESDAFRKALEDEGYLARETAESIRDLGQARIEAVSQAIGASKKQVDERRNSLEGEAEYLRNYSALLGSALAGTPDAGRLAKSGLYAQVAETAQAFLDGSLSIEEFNKRLTDFAALDTSSDFADVVANLRKLAAEADAGRQRIEDLNKELARRQSDRFAPNAPIPSFASEAGQNPFATDAFIRKYRQEMTQSATAAQILKEKQDILKQAEEEGVVISDRLAESLARQKIEFERTAKAAGFYADQLSEAMSTMKGMGPAISERQKLDEAYAQILSNPNTDARDLQLAAKTYQQARGELEKEANKAILGDVQVPADYMNLVFGAESSGNPNARNKRSTATGLGQFIESTWLEYFRKVYPELGKTMSDQAILALRTSPEYTRPIMEAFTKDNARKLTQAGFDPSSRNLYLSHFLGSGDALKALGSSSDTPVRGLLRDRSIADNPEVFKNIQTVGDLLDWAAKKMNAFRLEASEGSVAVDQFGNTTYGLSDAMRLYAEAQEKALEQVQFFGDTAYDAINGLVFEGEKLSDVFKNVAKSIGQATLKAVLLGQGPFAGAFGAFSMGGGAMVPSLGPGGSVGLSSTGGGGGLIGSLLGNLFGGFFADGGRLAGGKFGIVGEEGPELVKASGGGLNVIPLDRSISRLSAAASRVPLGDGGAGPTMVFHNDFRGADMAAVAAIGNRLERFEQNVGKVIDKRQRDREYRGLRA